MYPPAATSFPGKKPVSAGTWDSLCDERQPTGIFEPVMSGLQEGGQDDRSSL